MKTLIVLCFFQLISYAASECTAGWAAQNRMLIDSASFITTVSPNTKFSCDGEVTEWRFQAKASHLLRALVLRPVEGSPKKFTFVGFNDIPAAQIEINKPITYTVPEHQRISVQAGDVIGWSVGQAVLNWNSDSTTTILQRYNFIVNGFQASFDIADVTQGRAYSIQATVNPSGASECSAGWAVQNRANIDSASWFTTVSRDTKFACDGVVTEWQFQAKAAHLLRVVVLRPVEGSSTKYDFIGFNDIPASEIEINKPMSYTVPCNERIAVQEGDVIGWSVGKAVLNWDSNSSTKIFYQFNFIVNGFQKTIDMKSGSSGRQYSIKAIVQPSS